MKTAVSFLGVVLALTVQATERFICAGEQASFSSDGTRLVYQRLEHGHFGVYVRDLATGAERRVSPAHVDAIQSEWGPNDRIVWSEGHETNTAFVAKDDVTGWNLVEMNPTRRVLTAGRHRLFSPTYDAEGRLYFASEIVKPENGSTDVYSGNRTGIGVLTGEPKAWYRNVVVLKASNTGIADVHIQGNRMVRAEVAGYREPWRIVLSPRDKPEQRTYLTGTDMVGVSPVLSADGQRVAFSGCCAGDDGWYVYVSEWANDAAHMPPKRRIAKGSNPSFAPDGSRIVYDRGGQIFVHTDAAESVPPATFEKIALVDGSDFATIFDVETRTGIRRVLEHVARTGADTMLWRTHSGAMPRYRSTCENPYRLDHPVDTRRLPNISPIHSWMKLWRDGEDPLKIVFDECAQVPPFTRMGFHTLLEEAHWQFQYLGEWNLNHPQYWCRTSAGALQMYHASFAFPEVREHRLAIARELLARKPNVFYYDTFRHGGYTVQNEYVSPNLAEWARRYPQQPVPKSSKDAGWANWVTLCGENQYRYLEGIRAIIANNGGSAQLVVNVENLEEHGQTSTARTLGIDWRELIRRHLVDALAVTSITVDPADPLDSAERCVRDFLAEVNGRCKVYLPILNYNFGEKRPSYGQLANWADSDEAAVVRRLMALYDQYGASGVLMECVDYGNYSDAVCSVIKNYTRGDWRGMAQKAPPEPVADVQHLKMPSACMKKEVPLTVMLPRDYAQGNRLYPVAYLLHGAGNNEQTYKVKAMRKLAEQYGVIVVSPYGGNTWWMDAPEVPYWKYETMITQELVPWVDAHFRTRAQREGRLIAGHSMGGQGACRIGFRHKNLFATVGNVMGGVDITSCPERADLTRILGAYTANPQRWRDFSVLTEAAKLHAGDVDFITVVGDRDFFLPANRALHALLTQNNVAHRYIERPGEHTRAFAYRAMKDVFKFFAEGKAASVMGKRPMKRAAIEWVRTICQSGYIGWPSVCRLQNGDILAVFSGGRESHICPYGKIQMTRSKDNGETWSKAVTIADGPVDDRDAGIIQLKDGTIVVTYFTSIAYNAQHLVRRHPEYRKIHERLSPQEVAAALGYFRLLSKDNGETWGTPEKMASVSHAPHGPNLMRDGSLVMLGRSFGKDDDAVRRGIRRSAHTIISCWRSTDAGANWDCLCPEIADTNGENKPLHMFHEPHVVQLKNGDLIGLVRYHGGFKGNGYLRQTTSKDGGRTFSPMTKTPLLGLPPHLLELPDGKVVCVYGRRNRDFGIGEYATISDDGARTWDVANEITLAQSNNPDLGYPASCLLPDGAILTVYYQQPQPHTPNVLMATKWRIR